MEADYGCLRPPAQAFLGAGEGLAPAYPTTVPGCLDSKRFAQVGTEAPLLLPVTRAGNTCSYDGES